MKQIALFDMDGTLANYNFGIYRDLIKFAPEEWKEYIDKYYDCSWKLEETLWIKAATKVIKRQPGWWINLPKLQLGWDVLSISESIGFQTQILTKGPWGNAVAWKEKVEWVWKHFDGPRNSPPLSIVSGSNVVEEAKEGVYGRVLVEDYVSYLEPWLKRRPRGLGVLIDNESNRGWSHDRAVRYTGDNKEEVTRRMLEVYE